MSRKPLDEKYFTAEELAEIKALERSPDVRAGEKVKYAKYHSSPESKARAKARQRLYYLRSMAKLGRTATEG